VYASSSGGTPSHKNFRASATKHTQSVLLFGCDSREWNPTRALKRTVTRTAHTTRGDISGKLFLVEDTVCVCEC